MASGKGKWGKRAFSFGFRSRARRLGDFLRKGMQDALDEAQKEKEAAEKAAEKVAEDAEKAAEKAAEAAEKAAEAIEKAALAAEKLAKDSAMTAMITANDKDLAIVTSAPVGDQSDKKVGFVWYIV